MNMQKHLVAFFQSKEGEELIGNIVLKAVNFSFIRDMRFEDGKSDPGRKVEKTIRVNMLEEIVKYLPHIEAAIRGVQEDTDKARNRSAEVRDMMGVFTKGLQLIAEGQPSSQVLVNMLGSLEKINNEYLLIEDKGEQNG